MGLVQEFVEFCDLVQGSDDHDCWSMTWLDTVREGRSLVLRVAVHTNLDDLPDQLWEVGCQHTRAFSLVEFDFSAWTLSDDHVLLWEHEEPFSQLNFLAPASCHVETLWKLYERHHRVAGHWIPFERYLNPWCLSNRLSGGTGVLADGPHRLLEEYAEVLRSTEIEPYFPYAPRPPHRWDDVERRWVDQDEKLSVLILGGSSYVVGADFFANRVD
jgi:hypothetical protein